MEPLIFRIRAARGSDAAAMAGLVDALKDSLAINPANGKAQAFLASLTSEAFAARIAADDYTYLAADHEGVLAGFAAMRDGSHLYHLFVARPYQRRGIARALWLELHRLVLSNETADRITVNSNPSAKAVYEKFGFRQCAPCTEEHGVAFIPMQLRLNR